MEKANLMIMVCFCYFVVCLLLYIVVYVNGARDVEKKSVIWDV